MPFQSEKQRRFLWAAHPDIAKRWAHEYPNQRNLPTYAHEKKKTSEKQESSEKKEAAMARNVTTQCDDYRNTVVNYVQALIYKHANSAAVPVEIPHSEKPVSAGEESVSFKGSDQEGQLLSQLSNETRKPPVNETLRKLAVVLSQAIQQGIAAEQAAAQGQEAQPVPQNVNLQQSAQPASATPLPMGMAQAQSQQMQAAMPGAAPPAQAPQAPAAPQKTANVAPMPAVPQATAAPTPAPVGGKGGLKPIKPITPKSSPNFNPIQAYSGLSASGVIDGNASLGVKKNAAAASTPCSCGCGDTVKTCKCGPSCKCRKQGGSCYKPAAEKSAALGLWDRIRAKKERGGKPAKPGDKDYPDTKSWKKVTAISEKKAGTPAWQRSAGKNEEGGLNEKGRKSYEREHGGNLKAPVTEKNPKGKAKKRQNSFCSRMCGMKSKNTGGATAKDPDSRINKSLRKWNCKCSSAAQFGVKLASMLADAHKGVSDFMRGDDKGLDHRWGWLGAPVTLPATAASLLYANTVLPAVGKQTGQPGATEALTSFADRNGIHVKDVSEMADDLRATGRGMPAFNKRQLENAANTIAKQPGFYNLVDGEHHVYTNKNWKNPGILAHELGHATGGKGMLWANRIGKQMPHLGIMGALFSRDENNSRNMALGGTVGSLPMMASEIDASRRGASIMKNLKLKGRLGAYVGLPTYAALASTPMLAHYGKKYFGGFDKK